MERSSVIKLNSAGSELPMAYAGNTTEITGVILAGDIGGTKSNLALYGLKEGELLLINEATFKTKDYSSFRELLRGFLKEKQRELKAVCLGVGGPVTEGKVKGTNFPWGIDADEIRQEMDLESVFLINDLEATAYGVSILNESDFSTIKKGTGAPGNAAIIAPGTGLGEAGLFWTGNTYSPFASEGGHCEFSPRNESDTELWRFLNRKYGQVSWEHIISGSGIQDLFKFLLHSQNEKEPDWFTKKSEKEDPAAVISTCAKDRSYKICEETMELFVRYLAMEAAQLALKVKATGGIYVGGGIIPKIIDGIDLELFQKNFVKSDRMQELLEQIPVKAILNGKTALYGAAVYAAMKIPE